MIENPTSGVQLDVKEALDADLDAYLERELLEQPTAEVKPALRVEKSAERLQSVLALAAEEEQRLRAEPPVEPPAERSQDLDELACEVPEHLRVKPEPVVSPEPPVDPSRLEAPWPPLPAPLPGLAVAPHLAQQGLNAPGGPAVVAQSRTPWLVAGALAGVSAASVFVAAMLWMTRDSLPGRTQVTATDVPARTVPTVAAGSATTAPEPVLSVKDSPLPREPERLVADWGSVTSGTVEALPGPWVPGRGGAAREPLPPSPVRVSAPRAEPASGAVAQAVALPEPKAPLETAAVARAVPVPAPSPVASSDKSHEKVQARKVPAVEDRQTRRKLADPTPEDAEEEELPVLQPPQETRAPVVAKAEPPPEASSEPDDGSEFDAEFARKLGFTKDAAPKKAEPVGVKSVWIPPDPGQSLPETLTPEDIKQVVLANQPAISSCIQQHKEAIPGLSGGKFVVRWFVLPSGSTQQVAVETKELKGTALATCIEDLVRGWKFPKHRTQMGAIRFPFIF